MPKNETRFEMNMTEGPLLPKILKFALPLMLTSVLQLLYNAADIIVVGKLPGELGKNALAAVGSTGSLINLIVNIFIGLSVGTSIVTAQFYGARRDKDVSETVNTSVTISLISGVILGAFGYFCSRDLLLMMDNPPDVIDMASLYMKIYFVGMPFNLLYNFGSAVLRAVGDTKRPLYILTATGLVNVGLNLLFVLGFGMTVDGVAWATVIAQALSALAVVLVLVRSGGCIHLDVRRLQVKGDKLAAIARCGLPAGLQGTLFSISNVMIQSSINAFQSTVMAGSSAASNIEGFVYVIMNTFHQAALTFTGQNIGAHKTARVRATLLWCLLLVTVSGLAGGGLSVLFDEQLLRIYNADPEVIRAGCERLAIVSGTYFLCGLMDVLTGSLRGMGRSITPMIVSVAGICGLRILWIKFVFGADPTLTVLYLSYPVSWIVTGAAHAICFVFAYRKLKRQTPLEDGARLAANA